MNIWLNSQPNINSVWHFSFFVLGKGDNKSDQGRNGCDSSNMKYPSVHWKISGEYLNHPDNELDTTKLRTYEQKVQDYEAIYKFKNEQMVKSLQQSLHIMEDVSLSPQDKEKKIKNLRQKLLRKEICNLAEKLQTCTKDIATHLEVIISHYNVLCICIALEARNGWMN